MIKFDNVLGHVVDISDSLEELVNVSADDLLAELLMGE